MPETLLPAEISPLIATALMVASFGASFISAAFGLGGGVLVLAILASLLPPAALIPVHGMVQIGSNFGRLMIMRQHVHTAVLIPFVAGTIVGVAVGGLVAVDLPPELLKIAVGLFILWSIAAKPPAILRRAAWLVGIVSSFLTMFFGATGPFIAAYLRTLGLDRHGMVASQAACMTMQHFLKILVFGLLGFTFGSYIPLIAGMIAFGFAGTLSGKRVLQKIDEQRFKLVLNTILILLALRLVWSGANTFF